MQMNVAYHGYSCKGISLYLMNTDLLCVPLVFFNIILHVNAYCVCSFCSHVYTYYVHYLHILPILCLCMVYRFCAWCERSVHGVGVLWKFCAWCTGSVHGVNVQYMVWTFCAWCARSVHGVDVLCRVWTFCVWCARSVHGCSVSISMHKSGTFPTTMHIHVHVHRGGCLSLYYYHPTTSV